MIQSEDVIFYLTAALALFSAFRVVTHRAVFRSALYLALCLALCAVLYLLLNAEFVAAVQVLVYVGAVVILIIFAVMLTAQLGDKAVFQTNALAVPAAAACLGLWGAMTWVLARHPWLREAAQGLPSDGAQAAQAGGNTGRIGLALLDLYVLPFELTALLLFAALITAVMIARKKEDK